MRSISEMQEEFIAHNQEVSKWLDNLFTLGASPDWLTQDDIRCVNRVRELLEAASDPSKRYNLRQT
jgi:hypothetical protein